MADFVYNGKTYKVDSKGFLLQYDDWDENFAEGTAPLVQIFNGLTEEHWHIIHFARKMVTDHNRCAMVHEVCEHVGLRWQELRNLFPTGFLRGVCRLAGVSYKQCRNKNLAVEPSLKDLLEEHEQKTFTVDVNGFLVDPLEWTERYSFFKAEELKVPGGLTDQHWRVIHYLRESYRRNDSVPTVYETCEALDLDLKELSDLFPDGYHRGAVKLAGLRVL